MGRGPIWHMEPMHVLPANDARATSWVLEIICKAAKERDLKSLPFQKERGMFQT